MTRPKMATATAEIKGILHNKTRTKIYYKIQTSTKLKEKYSINFRCTSNTLLHSIHSTAFLQVSFFTPLAWTVHPIDSIVAPLSWNVSVIAISSIALLNEVYMPFLSFSNVLPETICPWDLSLYKLLVYVLLIICFLGKTTGVPSTTDWPLLFIS